MAIAPHPHHEVIFSFRRGRRCKVAHDPVGKEASFHQSENPNEHLSSQYTDSPCIDVAPELTTFRLRLPPGISKSCNRKTTCPPPLQNAIGFGHWPRFAASWSFKTSAPPTSSSRMRDATRNGPESCCYSTTGLSPMKIYCPPWTRRSFSTG